MTNTYLLSRLGTGFRESAAASPALGGFLEHLATGGELVLALAPPPLRGSSLDGSADSLFGEIRSPERVLAEIPYALVSPLDGEIRGSAFLPPHGAESVVFLVLAPDSSGARLTMLIEPDFFAERSQSAPTAVWALGGAASGALKAMDPEDLIPLTSDFMTLGRGTVSLETGTERVLELMRYAMAKPLLLREEVLVGLERVEPIWVAEQGDEARDYLAACRDVLHRCRELSVSGRWRAARDSIGSA